MERTLAEVARLMSMKPDSIVLWVEVVDGTLVTTSEGAQTLIAADGSCSAVLPRREVSEPGRGSVARWEAEQALLPKPDLTPLPEPPPPAPPRAPAKKSAGRRS